MSRLNKLQHPFEQRTMGVLLESLFYLFESKVLHMALSCSQSTFSVMLLGMENMDTATKFQIFCTFDFSHLPNKVQHIKSRSEKNDSNLRAKCSKSFIYCGNKFACHKHTS